MKIVAPSSTRHRTSSTAAESRHSRRRFAERGVPAAAGVAVLTAAAPTAAVLAVPAPPARAASAAAAEAAFASAARSARTSSAPT